MRGKINPLVGRYGFFVILTEIGLWWIIIYYIYVRCRPFRNDIYIYSVVDILVALLFALKRNISPTTVLSYVL